MTEINIDLLIPTVKMCAIHFDGEDSYPRAAEYVVNLLEVSDEERPEIIRRVLQKLGAEGSRIADWMPRPFPPSVRRQDLHLPRQPTPQDEFSRRWAEFLNNPLRQIEAFNMAKQRRDGDVPDLGAEG